MTDRMYVLHRLGDPAGGAPWRNASTPGLAVEAPDLPGHCGVAPPIGGNYDVVGGGFFVARQLVGRTEPIGAIAGVGVHGWSAQLLAIGGYATHLVLIDGLGEPWIDVVARTTMRRQRMRSLIADERAMEPYAGDAVDPRLEHAHEPHGSRELALEAAAATKVPTLLCTTGSVDDEVIASFESVTVEIVASSEAEDVMPVVAGWLRSLGDSSG